MRPRPSPQDEPQGDLFQRSLEDLVDPSHPLITLAREVDWARFDERFGASFHIKRGCPAISTRLMVALHYLKYTFDLSDAATVSGWVENPYWQFFSGMKFFQHSPPINTSSMTRWRKRTGSSGAEALLEETIRTGLKTKAIKPSQLQRVNVDTTVQEKHIRFPTDARLYRRALACLVRAAKSRGIGLRQSYARVGKHLLMQQSRYAHARQMKRARKCTRKLRTYLGRVIRDLRRKCLEPDASLRALLDLSERLFHQQRRDKNKVYSVHEPEVACIAKGKAHKRYEFGSKVALGMTSRGGWVVSALAFPGNPYDGHTLNETLKQTERVTGRWPDYVFVDRGYRGHDAQGPSEVHVDRVRRGSLPKRLWRWLKRRAAIEPGIGHLKQEHRMERNRLRGAEGDRFNALLSAVGMNFRKLMKAAAFFALRLSAQGRAAWIVLVGRILLEKVWPPQHSWNGHAHTPKTTLGCA